MALRAVCETEFDCAFLADHPMHEWIDTFARQRYSDGTIRLRVSHVGQEAFCVETDRRFKYKFAGLNPIRFRVELGSMAGVIPQDHWLAILKPLPISLWFMTRFVNRVAFVNRTDRDAVG